MPTQPGQPSHRNRIASTTAVIVLGAGLSLRFGDDDKLGTPLAGKAVAHHVLSTLSPFPWAERVLVHRNTAEWTDAYRQAGFRLARNDHPERGMLSSLKAGLTMVGSAPRVLICLADMPLVEAAHIDRLLDKADMSGRTAVATRSSGYRGPPAIFPAEQLMGLPLDGEAGARALLTEAIFVEGKLDEFLDIDFRDDLHPAEVRMKMRGE